MKISLNTQETIATLVHAASHDGLPPENIDYRTETDGKKKIVVAAMPRSGSTLLSNVLAQLTGLPYLRLCSAYSTNEHDLYLPALCMFNQLGYISQMHIKGTFHNAVLSDRFGIRLIVLVRNIFDAVVSLGDDLRKKKDTLHFEDGLNGYSFVWLDSGIVNFPDEKLLDYVIDLAVPWYVNFYVSWHAQCKAGRVRPLWVTYDDMMEDRQTVFDGIFDFIGISPPHEQVEAAIGKKYGTYNVGMSGRGRDLLTAHQQERIVRQFSYYPQVDFSPLGL